MFDSFRKSLEDLMNRATPPEERHAVAARMRETLVQAKVGLGELREGLAKARVRLAAEEQELETMRRRKRLGAEINDVETVALAERHEQIHAERVAVLTRKIAAQTEELALAEQDVAAMSAELRAFAAGVPDPAVRSAATANGAAADPLGPPLADEIDALNRARTRADREADAGRRLDELKRRMGK